MTSLTFMNKTFQLYFTVGTFFNVYSTFPSENSEQGRNDNTNAYRSVILIAFTTRFIYIRVLLMILKTNNISMCYTTLKKNIFLFEYK